MRKHVLTLRAPQRKKAGFCLLFVFGGGGGVLPRWGRLLEACSGGSRTLGCRTRLVRRTNFCACAQKCSHPPRTASEKEQAFLPALFRWRRRRDSNPRGLAPKRFSRPPRCDRFDTPPKRDCIITNGAGRVKRLSMREGEKTGGGRGKARGKTGQSGCVRGRRKRVKTCVTVSCGICQKRARSRSRERSKLAGHGARKI